MEPTLAPFGAPPVWGQLVICDFQSVDQQHVATCTFICSVGDVGLKLRLKMLACTAYDEMWASALLLLKHGLLHGPSGITQQVTLQLLNMQSIARALHVVGLGLKWSALVRIGK